MKRAEDFYIKLEKDIDLLSKLPKETQENLISYAAGMIAAQQILSRPQTA